MPTCRFYPARQGALVMLTQAERDAIWRRVFEGDRKAGVFGHERDLALEGEGWGITLARTRGGVARSAPQSASEEGGGSGMDEVERLGLENAKLKRRVVEVSREWAEESARRAALHFQVHKLSEDVKVLELNLAGARARPMRATSRRGGCAIPALRESAGSAGEEHPSDSLRMADDLGTRNASQKTRTEGQMASVGRTCFGQRPQAGPSAGRLSAVSPAPQCGPALSSGIPARGQDDGRMLLRLHKWGGCAPGTLLPWSISSRWSLAMAWVQERSTTGSWMISARTLSPFPRPG
jgi:hypothetical protein